MSVADSAAGATTEIVAPDGEMKDVSMPNHNPGLETPHIQPILATVVVAVTSAEAYTFDETKEAKRTATKLNFFKILTINSIPLVF